MILEGKKVAEEIYENIKNSISKLEKKPKLAVILVGKNSPSLRYIKQKKKWAEYVGMDFELINYDYDVTEKVLLDEINKLNNDEGVHGFMVQTPLPNHINIEKILNSINPEKDVDGFHPINQGKIVIGDKSGLPACTPAGVMEILKYYKVDVVGKNVVVIGRSNIVGKPLVNLLINAQATVTSCNSKTNDINFYTKNADIVITAMGSPNFLTIDKIDKKTIVIDVGFTVINEKIYGDTDFENIEKNGNLITPVPGGVGLLTVAMLLKNTLKAFLYKN